LSLTKLSLTEEEVEFVKQKVNEGVSGNQIAKMLGITQPKLWLNLEILGLNKKKNFDKKPKETNDKIFDWNDYKDKSLI